MSSSYTLIACVAYTLFVVGFGIFKSRNQADSTVSFYLSGRQLRSWTSAFSGAASAESGWVLLGLVGTAYATGVSALWLIPGTLTGYLFNWFVLAPRLRAASRDSDSITLPEFLALRNSALGRQIRFVSSVIILVFMASYVAAQFTAVGKTLEAIFDLPYSVGVTLGLVTVLAYVVTGGFSASVWTDFVQALFVVFTLVVLPVFGLIFFDGALWTTVAAADASLFDFSAGNTGFALLGFLVGWIGIGLGYPGQPHVLARFMATRDDRELRRAGVIATTWSTFVFTGAILMGIVARAWVPVLSDPEQALPAFASQFLPGPLAGLVLAAILAAICSTADSQLLVAASTTGHDILRLSGERSRRKNQLIVLTLGVLAALFALTETRVIFDFVLYAWAGLGAGLGPALIGTLFWPRTSAKGVLAGLIGGMTTVIVWKNIPILASSLYELVPAFALGLLLVRYVGRK